MNQWIETYLRNFVNGQQNNWSNLLPMAEFMHNSWKHESSKYSSHKLMTRSIPSAKITPLNDTVPITQSRLIELTDAQSNAQNALQKQITHSRVLRTLELNQKVWLDGHNL